ncbi:type II toxin-antitoxin system VapC family toxin [Pedobacter mendelii]|uniref:PIN domain-containing protein n=1 Tax=Pedobacter mendelii TaxID=1908240 RepID=A0ABQ2BE67_9SPHI|nr:type II toxin-antitoxin system VapC family toxin [Pedobacter mendelii]GGI22527.1 hypothetical protein GCM10008119_03090 [Pedobacter mendelii]
MDQRYLIDTSAVIKYLNSTFPLSGLRFMDVILDNECILSFISEIELQVWNPANEEDIDVYTDFIANSVIVGLEKEIIAETVRVRKFYGLKLPDALIAATCLVKNLTLIADNNKDFFKVPLLKCINPFTLNISSNE